MPGLNKKGPQNEGPMTGGRRGACFSGNDQNQESTPFGQGQGMGRRTTRGNCRYNGRGMNRGQGNSTGRGRGNGFRGQFR